MRAWGTGAKNLLLGTILALASTTFPLSPADATAMGHKPASERMTVASHGRPATARSGLAAHEMPAWARPSLGSHASAKRGLHGAALSKASLRGRRYARGGGISCVPFARSDSGIEVAGNAWQWWDNAAGVYARGSVPEAGSVLAFQANGRMRLGHVAVISRVINAREVEIDHANWRGPGMRGGVARNMPVVDVSQNNDWTAVRVGLGETGQFGSVYPTYGFIYDRADTGTMIASAKAPAPVLDLNPPPRDLRPANERGWQMYEEVAEVPVVSKHHRRGIDLSLHHSYRVTKVSTGGRNR
jgi:surface antigen